MPVKCHALNRHTARPALLLENRLQHALDRPRKRAALLGCGDRLPCAVQYVRADRQRLPLRLRAGVHRRLPCVRALDRGYSSGSHRLRVCGAGFVCSEIARHGLRLPERPLTRLSLLHVSLRRLRPGKCPSADRAHRGVESAAQRAAERLIHQLRKAELRVRVVRRPVRGKIHHIARALLGRLNAHLPQEIPYRDNAAAVQDVCQMVDRQLLGHGLDQAADHAAPQRLTRAYAPRGELLRALAGRLCCHQTRADDRAHARDQACRHARCVASDADAPVRE